MFLCLTFCFLLLPPTSLSSPAECESISDRYADPDEISTWLLEQARCHPDVGVAVFEVGKTHEGRRILVMEVKAGEEEEEDGEGQEEEEAIFLIGGQHAREWISPATVVSVAERVLREPSLRRGLAWFFAPLLNPDGYAFSRSVEDVSLYHRAKWLIEELEKIMGERGVERSNLEEKRKKLKSLVAELAENIPRRLWRNNRNPNYEVDSRCWGVDLNRNWGHKHRHERLKRKKRSLILEDFWAKVEEKIRELEDEATGSGRGSKTKRFSDLPWPPCQTGLLHSLEPGPAPFSEPETKGIAKFILSRKERIKAFFDVHSFGRLWLHPWTYTSSSRPCGIEGVEFVSNEAVAAIHRRFPDAEWASGQTSLILYEAMGTSIDWARSIGIPYAVGIELPPKSASNSASAQFDAFFPPETLIPSAADEFWEGLKIVASRVRENYFSVPRPLVCDNSTSLLPNATRPPEQKTRPPEEKARPLVQPSNANGVNRMFASSLLLSSSLLSSSCFPSFSLS